MFPTEIVAEIDRGKQYFSDLNEQFKADLKNGCMDCAPKDYYRLSMIMQSLVDKESIGDYDDVSKQLYDEMIYIIGGSEIPISDVIAYFGSKMDGTVLTYNQIIAQGTQVVIETGENVTIPFNVTGFERWWFAIPAVEGTFNKYEDTINVLNKGDIGTDQDLIGAPTLVTGIVNLNFYQNVYPVPQPNPLIIKKV